MKATITKLLTTFVAVILLCMLLPYQAHGQTTGKTVKIVGFYDNNKEYATLSESNGVYSALVSKSDFGSEDRIVVKVDNDVFKCVYKGYGWENDFASWNEAISNTTFYKEGKDAAIHFEEGTTYPFPFEEGLFTVTFTSDTDDTELVLSITDPNAAVPVNLTVNGTDKLLCEDINKFTGDGFAYDTPVTVAEGGSATIAFKVGDKTYGVAGGITFNAGDHAEQVQSATMAQDAGPLTLSVKGTYTVAVKVADGNYTLVVTKAASDKEMTFGDGNNLVLDKETGIWSGTITMSGNNELPAFVLNDYTTEPTTTKSYWFGQDIDDPKGEAGKTVTLSTTEPAKKAKCVTAGAYKFDVKIADDGTATATYINTAPPVEIKDLYVCLYDKHYAPDEWGNNWELGYNYNPNFDNGKSFSTDYKITYKLPDGSYAIAVYMEQGQSFYLMNNGVQYRCSLDDKSKPFVTKSTGEVAEEEMTTFTFSPSDDHNRRKYVDSSYSGYRMLHIKPDGANLKVRGYKMIVNESNRMLIVKSLAVPVDNDHMADVIIKFTIPKGKTAEEGYIEGYRKMQLNPSGTHALYNLNLKAGQTFEIWRGRAIKDADGNVTGIEEKDRVQYGCEDKFKSNTSPVTIVDGDLSKLYDEYNNAQCKIKTYSVVNDGEFNFVVFYTTKEKQFTISRKLKRNRGISIAVYDKDNNQIGDLVDMQYKSLNRRNLMTVLVPKSGHVKFGFVEKEMDMYLGNGKVKTDDKGEFIPFEYVNLGISNEVGYDTPITGKPVESQFNARDIDYKEGQTDCWYRFRIRLREDGNYCLSYQIIPMPEKVWMYVNKVEYEAQEDTSNPGHYIFTDVTLNPGDDYYFVNQKGETIHNGTPDQIKEATKNGLIWYTAHSSTNNGITEDNPVIPGRNINMFSHLNVGTDYNNEKTNYTFNTFKYSGEYPLNEVDVDMDIATMSHRYSYDFTGLDYYIEGNCVGIQYDGNKGWSKHNKKYKFEYHPTTGYYTVYLDYLWGDWFIYNYEKDKTEQLTPYYPYNLNNVVHELNKPFYLSSGTSRYVSDLKAKYPSGTAADQEIVITLGEDGKIPVDDKGGLAVHTYKDDNIISIAPGAVGIIQGGEFQDKWGQTPVYKDVTVVFDPANNVLWLESGQTKGKPEIEDPYGELYLIFTDVDAATWNEDRKDDAPDATRGKHWVKLERDENHLGHYTAKGITFPARQISDTESSSHSSYFFSNRIGSTLAETIRYSNSYQAGEVDPYLTEVIPDGQDPYGSVFTKLNYNEAGYDGLGSFLTDQKPLDLVNAEKTAYASTVYVRRWDNKEYAPFEDRVVPKEDGQAVHAAAPRRADDNTASGDGSADTGSGSANDVPILVQMTEEQPENLASNDYVIRAFASEPYTYDVDVHLGRKLFTLETLPKDIVTSVELVPAEGNGEARTTAVVRAAAGHISVTGAQTVSIYTVTGGCLLYGAPGAEIDVPHGLYIVVADGHATKHLL